MMKRRFILLLIVIFPTLGNTQSAYQLNNQLSLENYLLLVSAYHPVSKQANLVTQMANAQKLSSRGGFDPNLSASVDNKYFGSKNYWFMFDSKLEVPTWYGIELQAGYQYWQGDYFDVHERTPDVGLPYAGVSVSLGKNMFMDDRMATLKQAKIFTQVADKERQLILNDLYFEAIQAYLDWTYKYNQLRIFEEATAVAEERFRSTKVQFLLGEKPAIDTVEMLTVFQSRLLSLISAENEYKNAQLKLSNFLWYENNVPLQIPDSIAPLMNDSLYALNLFNNDSMENLIDNLAGTNAILQQLNLKQTQLQIDKTLKVNKILPQLDVTYNFLYNENSNVYFTNNYKLGIQFKLPLFFRKEIGDLRLAKYKLNDNQLKIDYKTLELKNKIISAYNDYTALFDQIKLYELSLINYKNLFDAESIKFQLGESTVFMVNSRETKYLEARLKFEELKMKVVKSLYYIYWTSTMMSIN